ncbi:hypothetical protein RN06_3413 [Mycobacterium tuberculosis variant bovis BCG]|nr:hypothetical protein RN06_3413 [Mycobacterium tuberculosis variant bovis BCG]AMC74295.1 hypothetical protein RN11_3285 [Mycobacterium tuberculosis]
MCRNITELRGLQPPATPVEIAAAARQYVRKVSGITHPSAATAEAFEAAVAEVTATTTRLLDALPPGGSRRRPSRRCADPTWLPGSRDRGDASAEGVERGGARAAGRPADGAAA